jgi:hypothetical protein
MEMTSLRFALLFGAAIAVGGLAAGCGPPVPVSPSYEADVRPIFISHCVRCHGAGGTLNQAREPTGPDAAPLASDSALRQLLSCYLNQFADTNCAVSDAGGSGSCHRGAQTWAALANGIGARLRGIPPGPMMPPPPAPPLNDWELKVVNAWLANPVCSNSATPDPTICP